MHVAIDIDGVVDRVPELLKLLTAALRLDGAKITILSSRSNDPETVEQSLNEVRSHGVFFSDHFFLPGPNDRPDDAFPRELDWYRK